jgi:hypothetical protein
VPSRAVRTDLVDTIDRTQPNGSVASVQNLMHRVSEIRLRQRVAAPDGGAGCRKKVDPTTISDPEVPVGVKQHRVGIAKTVLCLCDALPTARPAHHYDARIERENRLAGQRESSGTHRVGPLTKNPVKLAVRPPGPNTSHATRAEDGDDTTGLVLG